MKKFGIRKVKTWNGIKWGVVDLATKSIFTKDKQGNTVHKYKAKEIDVVEYKTKDQDVKVGLFAFTNDGFTQAKELQLALNK